MPRPRKSAPAMTTDKPDDEFPLPGMDDLAPDPQPARARAPRAASTRPPMKRAPSKRAPRAASGSKMTHAAMVAKVRAELYMWAGAGVSMWAMRDPCADMMFDTVAVATPNGMVEQERLAAIVDKLVDMISRNTSTLEFLANTGLVGEAAVIVGLMVPVIRNSWHHHGPSGVGHRNEQEKAAEDEELYPAYRP